MRVNDFAKFIKARQNALDAKMGRKHKPIDPIIAKYRFCNVRREDDRVTKWLRQNWYPHWDEEPMDDRETDPDIWFAAVVARLLNLPESLEAIREYVLPWKPAAFHRTLRQRRDMGKKNFNAAYIVSTNGIAMEKTKYLTERVLGPLWIARKHLRYDYGTLDDYHEQLMEFDGLGSFIAAQVIADLKYISTFSHASDRHTFVASGPGSRRGLNRVMERDINAPWREYEFRDQLDKLRDAVLPKLPIPIHAIDAQDVQNCLCEFDKYERARLGEGTPKQIYKEKVDAS
jgi:hypothetical protein